MIVHPHVNALGAFYYENRGPEDKHDLVEQDFDASGKLNVPGDWISRRESVRSYEVPFDTSGRFRSTARG